MLRKLRIFISLIFLSAITFLFLDFTGLAATWFAWMAKLQFIPAVLALNVGVIALIVVLTLLFGRLYCSVICPLGVMQDVVSWIRSRFKKNRFRYSMPHTWLRVVMLVLFIVSLVAGLNIIVALLAPYTAYGRMVASLLQPLWLSANNMLADWAAQHNSYQFYSVDVWIKSMPVIIISAVWLMIIIVMAWRGGRTYCNSICPVGTLLGFISRHSLFRPVIDTSKCNSCSLCERNCKSRCINSKEHTIDGSRCVACFDCLSKCRQGAISFRPVWSKKQTDSKEQTDENRRGFLTIVGMVAASSALAKVQKKVDGGLAVIEDKINPQRATKIVPPGAVSIKHFENHCTGCQLCITKCPNSVLRPSSKGLLSMMQPEMQYDRGYCRPECTACSDVCPAGAIRPITKAEKSAIHIGHAVLIPKNCVVATDGVECGNCSRHCPVGAIIMVEHTFADGIRKIPTVIEEKCIGCGACENLCPARPFSAIYVEGNEVHRIG